MRPPVKTSNCVEVVGMGKPQPGFVRICVRYRCAESHELSALTSREYRLPSPSVTLTVHHLARWTRWRSWTIL
jgi:hypothetical protein